MNQTTRLLAGAAVVAVVLVGGLMLFRPAGNTGVGAGPSPTIKATPSTTPTDSAVEVGTLGPLTETFTSARNGFTVAYPSGWTIKDATRPWVAGAVNNWGSGINDEVSSATARFSGASQALSLGQTSDQWMTAYANGSDQSSWPEVKIGGLVGKIDADGVRAAGGTITPGGVMYDAVVIVGSRPYNFNMDGNVDRPTFEAFLKTVTFTPSDAIDLPPLTGTFTSPRHGYRIAYPSAWTVQPATNPWPAGVQAAGPPDPMLDVYTASSGANQEFVVVSQPLPDGMTPDAWLAAYESSAPSMPSECWPTPDKMERATIDGQSAWIHGGLPICAFTEAVAFVGGRIYELSGYVPADGTTFDRSLFDALLAAVRFDPGTADDSPATSPAP